jgi:hypothetical protein
MILQSLPLAYEVQEARRVVYDATKGDFKQSARKQAREFCEAHSSWRSLARLQECSVGLGECRNPTRVDRRE